MHAINRKFWFYLKNFFNKYATEKVTSEEDKSTGLSPLS